MKDADAASICQPDLENRGNAMRFIEQENDYFPVGGWMADQNDHISGLRSNTAPLKPLLRAGPRDDHAEYRAGKLQCTGAGGHANSEPFEPAGNLKRPPSAQCEGGGARPRWNQPAWPPVAGNNEIWFCILGGIAAIDTQS